MRERPVRLSRQEVQLILLLCGIQFVHSVDFVLMMPLGPMFMETFQISAERFSLLVSSYTWASAVFGLLSALFVDRFDRKKVLLSAFAGFILGTVFCALSRTDTELLWARVLSGLFAGVMISTVFSIVSDVVPEQRRGAALGMLMAAFPVASVLGVPISVYLANRFDWHIPFAAVAGLSVLILALCIIWIPAVRGHLERSQTQGRISRLWYFVSDSKFWPSYGFSIMIMLAAFTVIPFIAASLVRNCGIEQNQLHWVYLCGGAFTFFTAQIFGRLTDRYGKLRMFRVLALISIVPILVVTHLPVVPLWVALIVVTLFMIFVSGRFVPGMTLLTGSVDPDERGTFMSVNTSAQQFASGVATYMGGQILGSEATGPLDHFGYAGIFASIFTLISVYMAGFIRNARNVAGSAPSR